MLGLGITGCHHPNDNNGNHQMYHFRQFLNAGLSSNDDAFLTVSVGGAYRTLRGGGGNTTANNVLVALEPICVE